MWFALALVVIALALIGALVVAVRRAGAAAEGERDAKQETAQAQHRADAVAQAGEVRREVDRGSFDDAVDRL